MARYIQNSNGKGSLKCIQVLTNQYCSLFNSNINDKLGLKNQKNINWLSPKKEDEYAEYRDEAFLDLLNLENLNILLKDFWPKMGPQWDALGKSDDDSIFLVEAKANIPEMISSPTGAKNPNSLELIRKSLQETKQYIGSTVDVDWSSYFYQYTNRLAHLYYLRVKHQIPAYLVFVYFIGDKSVNGPETKEEWLGALQVLEGYLGIKKRHKLSKYIIDVFIDVKDMGFSN